jgi:hypothetical protein
MKRICKGNRVKVSDVDNIYPKSFEGMYGTVVGRSEVNDIRLGDDPVANRAFRVKFHNRVNPVQMYEDELTVVKKKKK